MARSKQTTTNVSLTSHWRKFVRQKIDSGRYQSASEVVREGLRLIEERDQTQKEEFAGIRQAIEVGWKQSEAGDMIDGKAVFGEIRQHSATRRRKSGS